LSKLDYMHIITSIASYVIVCYPTCKSIVSEISKYVSLVKCEFTIYKLLMTNNVTNEMF